MEACGNARNRGDCIQNGGDKLFDERRLRAQLVLKGMTLKELADRLKMNESTLYRKMKDDGAFSREEINTMIDILDIEDPMAIFFAN